MECPAWKPACVSVSEQTGVSLEMIVVDNGSSDGSRNYIQEHFPQCVLGPLIDGFQDRDIRVPVIVLRGVQPGKDDGLRGVPSLVPGIRVDQRVKAPAAVRNFFP